MGTDHGFCVLTFHSLRTGTIKQDKDEKPSRAERHEWNTMNLRRITPGRES